MKKKAFFALLIVVVLLCVCFVGCDNATANQGSNDNQTNIDNNDNQTDVGNNDNQDNQTDTDEKDIRNLANQEKFEFILEGYLDSFESKIYQVDLEIRLDVDFTKLSNYQEVLAELGLSENYETPEERIEAGYYLKLNEYYVDQIKSYFPNGRNLVEKRLEGEPNLKFSILKQSQFTRFWYDTLDEANKEYDSLLRLSERDEIIGIRIVGYAPLVYL